MSGPVLEARGVSAGYASGVAVIEKIDVEVRPGEIVGLFGSNGAGKTTTLLTLAGELRPSHGSVRWRGRETRTPLHRRARKGLSFVTEERSIFPSLTVHENLRLSRGDPASTYALFPELEKIRHRRAGLLSGGEQQMLSVGRAIGAKPDALLVDELSLGLAPMIVQRLLATLRRAADDGIGVLLVEQQVHVALDQVDRAYLLKDGRIALAGTAAAIASEIEAVESAYFG